MSGISVDTKNIDLPWDPKRRELKGFAYIGCSEPAHVVRVVALNGANFHGANIAASVAANPITDVTRKGPPGLVVGKTLTLGI